jgi:hypothetical protein
VKKLGAKAGGNAKVKALLQRTAERLGSTSEHGAQALRELVENALLAPL